MFASLHKNYFYFFRLVMELNQILKNRSIVECYTQERDKLFIHIPLIEYTNHHLIISTSPQDIPFLHRTEHHKAKKNTFDFFKSFLPARIENIDIAFGERIIRVKLENGFLYFIFRGMQSNCILILNDGNHESFKKISAQFLDIFLSEIKKMSFMSDLNSFTKMLNSFDEEQLKKAPFISKELRFESELRSGSLRSKINNIINEIIEDKIAIGASYETKQPFFSPISFLKENDSAEVELFDTYFEAANRFQTFKKGMSTQIKLEDEVEKFVEKELEKVTEKLNNLKARIQNGSNEKNYRKYGDLLLSNIHLLKKGMKQIIIDDWKNNEEIEIKLDATFSPQQNVNRYFDKSRAEKIDFEKSKELFDHLEEKYNKLITTKEQLNDELSLDELLKIKKELKVNPQKLSEKEKKEKIPFRHFIISGQYNFYIGKDSKNNDLLTTKFAKPNDYWFHARSVAGSHGVLRIDNLKESIPKKILEKAASITAFYSKSKTSKLAPVTYTLKKYVVKNQRHEPGQVSVMKESVLLVRPEIPDDCVQQTDY